MKRHKFSHTNIELHPDGSATVEHVHESNPAKNVKHAVVDINGIHDSLQDHLNPEEVEEEAEHLGFNPEQLEEKVAPGIHEKILEIARGK